MKKALALGALALLAGVIVGTMVTPAGSQVPPERTTLTFFDPNATDFDKDLNTGGKGFAGDMFLTKDSFFDPETCEKAGTLLIRGQVVKSAGRNDAFTIFDGGVRLPDGKITFSSPAKFSDFAAGPFLAVTGGTEAYKDVSGDVTVTEDQQMCEKNGALITMDLLLQ
jgi:hypothetical protein